MLVALSSFGDALGPASVSWEAKWIHSTHSQAAEAWHETFLIETESMFHKCYHGMKFPYFAKPLAPGQFGTKIMAQSRGAVRFLKDKPLHCFTSYGDHGWVWMNLETFDGIEVKAKPVKLQSGLPNSLIEKLHVKRKWPKEL